MKSTWSRRQRIIRCLDCGELEPHYARDLCSRCWYRRKRKGPPAEYDGRTQHEDRIEWRTLYVVDLE